MIDNAGIYKERNFQCSKHGGCKCNCKCVIVYAPSSTSGHRAQLTY